MHASCETKITHKAKLSCILKFKVDSPPPFRSGHCTVQGSFTKAELRGGSTFRGPGDVRRRTQVWAPEAPPKVVQV